MTIAETENDAVIRCAWAATTEEFAEYHDTEWGFPVKDDRRLFEKICLEGFQSGLSWRTILAKRDAFRVAFAHFDFHAISGFNDNNVAELLQNKGIVRHRGKIEAVINNAQKAIDMEREFGSLAAYFWSFEPTDTSAHEPQTRSTSAESVALSKDLKKRGWKFVGPTTVFAFMQAMGLINDHQIGCHSREKAEKARQKFDRP